MFSVAWQLVGRIGIQLRMNLVQQPILHTLFLVILLKPRWKSNCVCTVEFHAPRYYIRTRTKLCKICGDPVWIYLTIRVFGHQDTVRRREARGRFHRQPTRKTGITHSSGYDCSDREQGHRQINGHVTNHCRRVIRAVIQEEHDPVTATA
jgi:hypothetical protein